MEILAKIGQGASLTTPSSNETTGETSGSGSGSVGVDPEPMELGVARRRTLMKAEYQKLRSENACFYC